MDLRGERIREQRAEGDGSRAHTSNDLGVERLNCAEGRFLGSQARGECSSLRVGEWSSAFERICIWLVALVVASPYFYLAEVSSSVDNSTQSDALVAQIMVREREREREREKSEKDRERDGLYSENKAHFSKCDFAQNSIQLSNVKKKRKKK